MAPLFPAVLIGGPPHSGKSTLTYRLSHALRGQAIAHYALRASPDGEGDWSNEAAQANVAELRMRARHNWTPAFAAAMSRDIANRHLPLLVDAGGQVSSEIEQIAAQCTHALLIAADPSTLAPWRNLAARHGLPLIADLRSDLSAAQQVHNDGPALEGIINGLSQGASPAGVCFDGLLDRLGQLFAYDADELYRSHLAMTDVELVIHVERAIHPLPQHTADNPWRPSELPALTASLPAGEPIGIYGRGPVWLYATLAALNAPNRCMIFDVRQGWIAPPRLTLEPAADPSRLRWDAVTIQATHTHVQFSIPGGYLDYRRAAGTPVPVVRPDRGVVLDGKLPNWLWAALTRAYEHASWVAIFQPQLGQAVVVRSQASAVPIGKTLPLGV